MEEVYSMWESYFRSSIQMQASIPRDCASKGKRMLGVLNLRLPSKRDSALAQIRLATVLKLTPRAEMWDLWLPLETQSYWDAFRETNGRARSELEIWEDRWLPPVKYSPAKDPESINLRNIYHRNRLLYANARDDATNYYKIMTDTRSLRDPTFSLLRTDVMLRLGSNIVATKKELERFEGLQSKVLAEGDLVGWHGRLGTMIKERSGTLEKKDTATVDLPRVQVHLKQPKAAD